MLADISTLSTARVALEPSSNSVALSFNLHGQPGRMELSMRPQGRREDTHREFRRKVFAAARAENGGRPVTAWESAIRRTSGPVRPRAIRILTNPENWRLMKLRHGDFRIVENASGDGSVEALAAIEKAAKKFGRHALSGGNCGTFSLALATHLRDLGFSPEIAFIFRYRDDVDCKYKRIADVIELETDIYHVVVTLGDRMFDATGETSLGTLIHLATTQYGDREPGFWPHAKIDDRELRSLIEHDTDWSVTSSAFYTAIVRQPKRQRTARP